MNKAMVIIIAVVFVLLFVIAVHQTNEGKYRVASQGVWGTHFSEWVSYEDAHKELMQLERVETLARHWVQSR